jgi:hypothetical protein
MHTKNKVKLHQHLLVYGALGTEVLFWLKRRILIIWLEDCNQKRIPIGTIGTEEEEEIPSEGEGCVSKEILIKKLEQMFRNLETVTQQIMDLDSNVERSMIVRRTLENRISCYRKMYEEKKKATSV